MRNRQNSHLQCLLYHYHITVHVYVYVNILRHSCAYYLLLGEAIEKDKNAVASARDLLSRQKQELEQMSEEDLQNETAQEKTDREAQIADIETQIEERNDEIQQLDDHMNNKCSLANVYKTPGFLPKDSPDFLHTQTYNNNYDINYGYLSTCMETTETQALFHAANKTNRSVQTTATRGKGKGRGKSSTRVRGKGSKARATPGAGGSGTGAGDQPTLKLSQQDIDNAYHSNEVIRTVSSCMETSIWGMCTYTDYNNKCKMPNAKRTPDVIVAAVPENSTKYLRFPLLVCEILGKKPAGQRYEQKFDGFNASMQPLVFSHRGYYWEIVTTDVHIYKLEKVPEKGYIKIHEKVYDLVEEIPTNAPDNQFPAFAEMVEDLCAILLDCTINLAPICLSSANCLTDARYKDFLNIPSVTRRKIEPHCWHIFVPEFLADDQKVKDAYLPNDAEDPMKPAVDPNETVSKDHVPTEDEVLAESCVIPVDEDGYDYSQIQDKGFYNRLPCMRSVRVGPEGRPATVDDFREHAKQAEKSFSANQAMYRVKELFRRQKMSGIQILEEGEKEEDPNVPLDITADPNLAAATAEQADRMTILQVYDSDDEPEENDQLFEFETLGDTSVISGGGDNLANVIFEIDDYGVLTRRKRRIPDEPLVGAPKKRRFSVDPGTADFLKKLGNAKVLVYPGTPAAVRAGPSGDPGATTQKKARRKLSMEERQARAEQRKKMEEEQMEKLKVTGVRKRKQTEKFGF